MTKITPWFFCLWFFSTSGAAIHADTSSHQYTLRELLEHGLEHNSEIGEAQWRVQGATARLRQARSGYFLPYLRLESQNGLVPDAKGDVFNPTSDTTGLRPLGPFNRTQLEFVQPLYTFGYLSNLRRAAAGGLAAEQAGLAANRVDIAFEIKELYYGALLALDLQSLVWNLTEKLQERAGELEDNTAVSLSGTYKLKLAVLELESQEREIADQLELARAALRWKTGLPENRPISLEAKALEPVQIAVPPLDTLIGQALRNRPDWHQLQAGIAAKKALIDAARSEYFPQIFLAGGIRYAVAPNRTDQRNPFAKDDFNYFNGGIFLGLRQSFEWGLLDANVDKARAEHLELKAKEGAAVQGISLDIKRAYLAFQQTEENLNRARQKRRLTRQWLKLAQEEYEFDPGEVKELITAFEAWSRTEQDYYEAIHAYNLNAARVAQAMGFITLDRWRK